MEKNNGPEQDQEQYSFLQEKIKDDTINKKKIIGKISKTVGAGLIFGIAASMGFFALKPWAETVFHKDPKEITIPKDDEAGNDATVENMPEPIKQALTMEDYKQLDQAMRQVILDVKKSMVEVIAVQNLPSWEAENKDEVDRIAGVIIADNGPEFLILANTSILKDDQEVKIRFADDSEYKAAVKKHDNNIGMVIFGVAKSEMKDSTIAKIKVAKLGNSYAMVQGNTLIALGNPFGHDDGVGFGVASTVDHNVLLADGAYNVIVTDMSETEKSSGVLFDVEGELVGILQPEFLSKERRGVLTAFGISSIKNEIELLANSKDVPYIGIVGAMVPKEISESQNIPEGLYVKEVEADSPALKAGIQSGDVITDVGDMKINSLMEYHNAIIELEVGQSIRITGKRRGAGEYVEFGFNVNVGIKK